VCDLPNEIKSVIELLSGDYEGFEYYPLGANGYLIFAKNIITQAEVAIKFYFGELGDRRHDEPRLLASIQSDNVLRILDARNVSEELAYFITPKCDGGDLDSVIGAGLSVSQAIDIALGICVGLSEIHRCGLVHRDLKPANILYEQGRPLIADFGSVRLLPDGSNDVPASKHSVLYRPPESFETGRYNRLGDIYQIGLITYQLLGGVLNYDELSYLNKKETSHYHSLDSDFDKSVYIDEIIYNRVRKNRLIDLTSLPPWIGGDVKSAIRSMTNCNLEKRFDTTSKVAAALTRIRVSNADWKWDDEVAVLEKKDRVVQVRPVGNGNYEAFQNKNGTYRKVGGVSAAPLAEIVKKI
jgi:serine/threonine protein kinase